MTGQKKFGDFRDDNPVFWEQVENLNSGEGYHPFGKTELERMSNRDYASFFDKYHTPTRQKRWQN